MDAKMKRNDEVHDAAEIVSDLASQVASLLADGMLMDAAEIIIKAQRKAEELIDWSTGNREDMDAVIEVFVETFDDVYRMQG